MAKSLTLFWPGIRTASQSAAGPVPLIFAAHAPSKLQGTHIDIVAYTCAPGPPAHSDDHMHHVAAFRPTREPLARASLNRQPVSFALSSLLAPMSCFTPPPHTALAYPASPTIRHPPRASTDPYSYSTPAPDHVQRISRSASADSLSVSSASPAYLPTPPIAPAPNPNPTPTGEPEAEISWNLVPCEAPFASTHDGAQPGANGSSFFLRSPTPTKRQRTVQACEKCRERKAKCNGARPCCMRCASRGLPCVYPKERRMRGPNKNRSGVATKASSESVKTPSKKNADIVANGSKNRRSTVTIDLTTEGSAGQRNRSLPTTAHSSPATPYPPSSLLFASSGASSTDRSVPTTPQEGVPADMHNSPFTPHSPPTRLGQSLRSPHSLPMQTIPMYQQPPLLPYSQSYDPPISGYAHKHAHTYDNPPFQHLHDLPPNHFPYDRVGSELSSWDSASHASSPSSTTSNYSNPIYQNAATDPYPIYSYGSPPLASTSSAGYPQSLSGGPVVVNSSFKYTAQPPTVFQPSPQHPVNHSWTPAAYTSGHDWSHRPILHN
ncbi:hypothetical protein BOTBODRAFT_68514 [Botryobasidium botryosum FD-172 SS1]|uniref:Zn(2)-C6 fungal-type domain-containing protein n=1 Tax=Botryobasidium botryosum (strain FD-172 SS1) TaxID=930990 RepID=A0A067MG81_BOTB1|nr:hypothetical protein BOTBODRAFT_68514 [Botryobasidium botryosum FD-172 SS1]